MSKTLISLPFSSGDYKYFELLLAVKTITLQAGARANHREHTDRYAGALCAGPTGRREYNP